MQKFRQVNRTFAGRRLASLSAGLALASVASSPVSAGSATWSSTNVQYLYGTNYELGDDTRSVVTLEHVNGWKYGDNFFFVDITNPDRSGTLTGTEFYGEISPRFSLSAISGKPLSAGLIKDVLVTTTIEMGDAGSGFHNYLYGLAVDLNIPNVPVFQINYYARNEIGAGTDTGSQLTLVWLAPFTLGSTKWSFEGFLDYAFGNDPNEDNLLTAPRLLLDVGHLFGAEGQFQGGIEHQIWRNKFGIEGVDEDVTQAMVKWIW